MSLLQEKNQLMHDTADKEPHRILIFPNPNDGSFEAHIHFPTKSLKEAYITQESRYCALQYQDYAGAMGKDARARTWAALCARRVAFAVSQHYAPKTGNKRVWERKNRLWADTPPSKSPA